MYELGPNNGKLTIRTGRAGLAAAAGHDLVIEAERWMASLTIAPEPEQSQLRATVDATSLAVREGNGGLKPLTDRDREEILKNIRKVLQTDRHPEITFTSTAVRPLNDSSWILDGDLTLAGATAPVQIPIEFKPGTGGTRLTSSVTIAQTSFGIKPYSGMFGALKVADNVEIRAEAAASDRS